MEVKDLVVRESDGKIQSYFLVDTSEMGPNKPGGIAPPGHTLQRYEGEFDRAKYNDTTKAYWRDGEVEWVDSETLEGHIKAAINATYPDVDAIYEAAVGRRVTEYARAEEAAREYIAAEVKPAVVSGYIAGHAESQGQTNEWAARQIIERADAFRWAELQMRNVRFTHQASMRAATTIEELETVVASWKQFVEWLRGVLGV